MRRQSLFNHLGFRRAIGPFSAMCLGTALFHFACGTESAQDSEALDTETLNLDSNWEPTAQKVKTSDEMPPFDPDAFHADDTILKRQALEAAADEACNPSLTADIEALLGAHTNRRGRNDEELPARKGLGEGVCTHAWGIGNLCASFSPWSFAPTKADGLH